MQKLNLMDLLKSTLAAVVFTLLSLSSAFSQSYSSANAGESMESKKSCDTTCATKVKSAHVKSAKVIFQKDKVYEIVFFSLTKGKEKQVFEEYLPKSAPYFEKYGVKTIGMFNVEESRSEELQSQMIGIFEWPNYEAKEKLEADKGFQKVAKLREGGFSFFKGGWFAPKEDKEVVFYSNKVYEMAGATIHPTKEAQASLGKYFEVSEPIKRNYGGTYPEFLVNLNPIDSKGTSTYSNDMQFIVEWDSIEDNTKLFADEDFKIKAAPLMMAAIAKADFVFAKFIFEE